MTVYPGAPRLGAIVGRYSFDVENLPLLPHAGLSRRFRGSRLALDDVVDLKHLGLPGIYPHVRQERHQALPERVKLLARVPDLADADAPVRDETAVVVHPVRREVPALL